MKKKIKYYSACCNAEVKSSGIIPDFIGDIPDQMHVGTCYCICSKCGEPCNIRSKK
jgi:hypothetical protein